MREAWKAKARQAAEAYPDLRKRQDKLGSEDRQAVQAVERALRTLEDFRTGKKRLRLVEMVFFRRTHTLYGAGVALEVSEETARAWGREFLVSVWTAMGRE